ncbi:hypothetical protein CU254_18570 [Amycolatopsis sp. AA4]|uniref:membrane protein n=1 Tax=Actinomycetes TaxID=1760 RepID=UPI0001B56AF3|nr:MULTISPECIES: membrane protein [Actinomycetes]ATY12247.1 hypothetical protein CU254_18570 [Amycolatopsis sp. AA4]EFL07981.1 predicted protein [Streptomyces sp. AA4]
MTIVDKPAASAAPLRRLYFARFAFALVWAALLFLTTKSQLGPLGVVLVVGYPLFDVAAAVVDARSTRAVGLYVNIAISLLAGIGLAVASASGVPAVLRVWGAWAVAAGLVQLSVAVGRREMGGQWPMILSGGISVLAGVNFVLSAGAPAPSLAAVAGYAVLGGIFFLVSALRLGRTPVARGIKDSGSADVRPR